MSDHDSRICILQQALMESDIDPAERDALADDLQYAQSINGSPDQTLQGIKRLTISGVRREMLGHARLAAHARTCQLRHAAAIPQDAEPFGPGAKALIFIRALTPWRWPLAIAVFSPFAGDVAARIIGVFR